jgi:large subunit ribosomal protein L30
MKLALIRLRGKTGVRKDISDTLVMLNLPCVNSCVVVEKNSGTEGMIRKCKDFLTWGEISDETIDKMKSYGRQQNKRTVYHLRPPIGGFERKGIKKPFSQGGALGYRGERINDLIRRMLGDSK